MKKFTTRSTSLYSQNVNEPIIIEEKETTRKIFLAEINDKKLQSGETVSGTIIHQRKSKNDKWEDIKSINLNTLKAGEGVKLKLRSTQIKKLYDGLTELYALSKKGVKSGENEYIVGTSDETINVPKKRKEYIEKLLQEDYGQEIWDELVDNNPDLATKLSNSRIQNNRLLALKEFENSILDASKNEQYWQDFFTNNEWIFGYGLNYQFLSIKSDQPNYGGQNYAGKGKQKGDYLTNTNSDDVKFTVLVEIKKPSTDLIAKSKNGEGRKYRNGAWLLGSEVLGGVAQVQANCKSWQRNSEILENRELMYEHIYTVQPKGILLIGNTEQFKNDMTKLTTFELFRKGLNSVEILTYDELLERAKFILGQKEKPLEEEKNDL
ncbi:MAG: DUF4263 domain-containing protein [Flavobacteriaceae bacterium]|nr:DUF4263 domain-containing protein [Flavobacteriaceae bacterium]